MCGRLDTFNGWCAVVWVARMTAAEIFLETLPDRPRCSDDLRYGLVVRGKQQAASMKLIQPNTPMVKRWLTFDIDRSDAYFAFEERSVPIPNFIAVNRENGHAHYGYLLRDPVLCFENASGKPVRYLQSLRDGLTRRLGADAGYTETLCKNPIHPRWETEWNIHRPYELSELFDCLDKSEQKPTAPAKVASMGRNCAIFESVRHIAYRNVTTFQQMPDGYDLFFDFIGSAAYQANAIFTERLPLQEVHNIVKSICKWTWQRFSKQAASEWGRRNVIRRWAAKKALIPDKYVSLTETKPWETLGVSRATWYRRQKDAQFLDTATNRD